MTRTALTLAAMVILAGCTGDETPSNPLAPSDATKAAAVVSAPPPAPATAGPVALPDYAAAAPGIKCNWSGKQCWRETGYFHPDCGHKAWCIGVTRRPAAGSATPGLVEIRVGRWAPAFDRTLEWRINHRQGFPSDPYLAAELKVRDRGCGHDQLLGIEGPDCIVKILPDQISSMHDRRGRPRTKRALKTIVTDFWNPNPGFGRNDDCDSPWDARLTMVVQEITGFGRTEGTVPVRVCR